MKAYYGEELLLENEAAKKIYEEIKNLPIIDYHCHLDEKAIMKIRNSRISASCGFRATIINGARCGFAAWKKSISRAKRTIKKNF